MGKQNKSKRKRQSSQSSSRRSYSPRRSPSSESVRHKSKKSKSKYDERQKQSKRHRSDAKQRKRSRERQRQKQKQKQRKRSRSSQKPKDPPHQNKQQQRQTLAHQKYEVSLKNQNKLDPIKDEHQQDRQNQASPMQQNKIQKEQESRPQKQQPCFEPSGILLEYYNAREGVSLRFHEPPQGRQPDQQWRVYVFKGEQVLKPIELTKSCYLVGKDERVVDILAQNPSISRQHCVIQFRLVQKRQTQGEYIETIKPYVMDLESTNGTFLNEERIESGRYYELLHRDVLKFGFSDREYVIVKWDSSQQQHQKQEN